MRGSAPLGKWRRRRRAADIQVARRGPLPCNDCRQYTNKEMFLKNFCRIADPVQSPGELSSAARAAVGGLYS
jgi:hypothetical protein